MNIKVSNKKKQSGKHPFSDTACSPWWPKYRWHKPQKTLEVGPAASPSDFSKNVQRKAIKTASLDHITKPSVLSCSPPECLLYCYETSWIEEKETQWPVLRGKKDGSRGKGNQMRAGSPVSLMPSTLCYWCRKCQLALCKHSSPVQWPSPRKLSLLNSCVIAGLRPTSAWWWGGVGRWVEWLIRATLLSGISIVPQIR